MLRIIVLLVFTFGEEQKDEKNDLTLMLHSKSVTP